MKRSRLIMWLLALLGFGATAAGCGKNMYAPLPAEYGTPHALFELKGKVTDAEGRPVQGIEILAKWVAGRTNAAGFSATTDETGGYRIEDPYAWPDTGALEVTAQDVDGADNGGDFVSETAKIEVKDSDYVGGDGSWYQGELSKTADFTLTLKPNEKEESGE